MEKMLRDRHQPLTARELHLKLERAGLDLGRRLDQPAIAQELLLLGEISEEPLERLLTREEELPRLVVATKEGSYAREM